MTEQEIDDLIAQRDRLQKELNKLKAANDKLTATVDKAINELARIGVTLMGAI